MLHKKLRIRTGKEYNTIYKYGKKIGGRHILVYIIPNKLGRNRFGVITSKKVGKAVRRNKVKRQLRSIIRTNLEKLGGQHDVVVIARYNIYGSEYRALEKDFLNLMKKAGLC
ncbi:MAG TPA: ribonuclease P protein component [Syntrophomonadaceae bacterium]|nr:ribonuclease P protein component [Syntrophomonadaceae bacterium]